MRQAKDIPQNR